MCWEYVQAIVTWRILTTAAIYQLDAKAVDDFWLMKRAFCLFAYYGWALASTVILASARVQSQGSSINITTVTAIVLLLMSLVSHLQLYKQTASYCSTLFHLIPLVKAWIATAAIAYVACSEVGAILLPRDTAVAELKQGLCYWCSTSSCSSNFVPSKLVYMRDPYEVYTFMGAAVWTAAMIGIATVWEMIDMIADIRTNAKTSTTSSVAKWRQQQAYMIQSSYSEGSVLKRCAIDAYLKQNCYIQVLQPVNKQTTIAATEVAHGVTSTGYSINSVTQADLSSIKADMTMPKSSAYKVLQIIMKVPYEFNGTMLARVVLVTAIAFIIASLVADVLML
jgi:hypothetical protein